MIDQTPAPQSVTRRWPFLSLAAAGFVLLVTLGPLMATSRIDASGSQDLYSAGDAGMLVAREAAAQGSTAAVPTIAEAPPGTSPQTSAPAPTSTTTIPADPPATAVDPPDVAAIAASIPPIDGGAIEITMSLPPDGEPLTDGGTATWEIALANTGDEYLWGVYVYMEGYGALKCDQRQLSIGASATCRVDQGVWAGEQSATAWVTAWTANRMVEAATSQQFLVGG